MILNKKNYYKSDALHRGSVSRRCPNVDKLNSLGHKNKFTLLEGLKKQLNFIIIK